MNSSGIEIKSGASAITMTPDDITIKSGKVNIQADEINAEASGSTVKIDKTINVKASDTLTTVDKVIISTHDHQVGNLGYPTGGGPTKTGE